MKVSDLQRNMAQQILDQGKASRVQPGSSSQVGKIAPDKAGERFSDVLQTTLDRQDGVKFSAHAMKRLDDRNIAISPDEIERLNDGVKRVEEKGGRNSLIMIDDRAYVVSIQNRTVVTALPKDAGMGNVFTNIDSVLIN